MAHVEAASDRRSRWLGLRCFAELLLPHFWRSISLAEEEISAEALKTSTESFGRDLGEIQKDNNDWTITSLGDFSSLGAIMLAQSLHPRKKPSVGRDGRDDGDDSSSSSPSPLTRLSVMSYNVFFHPRQGQDRVARRRRLVEALERFEVTFGRPLPDVIAFQEVDDAFVTDEGLQALYPYRTERKLMNMIASKHPIVDFQHFDRQPGNMLVTLDLSGDEARRQRQKHSVTDKDRPSNGRKKKLVHLLNIHLHAGSFCSGHEERLKEYEELRSWISSMSFIQKGDPVIIAGDFNDETNDLTEMGDWVVRYDHATTGTFVDGQYRLGSWSSRANWLVALHFQSRYRYYPRGYTKTIDYVAYDKRFLAPEEAGEMHVLGMKGLTPWEYKCEGPSPWCDAEAMQHLRGKWDASTWFDGGASIQRLYHGTLEKGDDLYDELSDHFPVIQDYAFRL